MKWKRRSAALLLMFSADAAIKIIVSLFLSDIEYSYFDLIGFRAYLNKTQLSIFNNELGLNISTGILIILNVILLILLEYSIRILKAQGAYNTLCKTGLLLLEAGAICSLTDKIFWQGSLDYIIVLFKIVDLKDIYLFAGAILALAGLIQASVATRKAQ